MRTGVWTSLSAIEVRFDGLLVFDLPEIMLVFVNEIELFLSCSLKYLSP